MTQPFSLGGTISLSLRVACRNFVPFVFIALLIHAPWLGLVIGDPVYAAVQIGEVPVDPVQVGSHWLGTLLQALSSLLVSGTFVFGTYRYLRGQPASIGECFAQGIRSLPRVLVSSFLMGLRIAILPVLAFAGLSMVLSAVARGADVQMFVILLWIGALPILIWLLFGLARFYLVVPATVIEGLGPMAACRRSSELTRGVRLRLVGLLLFFGAAFYALVFGVTQLLSAMAADHVLSRREVLYGSIAASLLGGIFCAVVPAVAYFKIRRVRENIDIADMTNVFA